MQRVTRLTSNKFRPLRYALSNVGIDVEQLIRFILIKRNALENAQLRGVGDDARDYMSTAYFLRSLSRKALNEIVNSGQGDIRRRLKEKTYPFSRLNKQTREALLHLPNSWIHGGADWLLNAGKDS